MRWILYVDMDAYYVACELRDRPDLVGKKVVVGADPHRGPTRGVVLSASYEARADGVRSAMPVGQADRLSPDAVWLPPDFPKYEHVAGEIRTFLRARSPEVLPLSIDEAAVRIESADAESARTWALRTQEGLRKELRLSASIGVAPSRVVAKIASERAKPGGIVVVPPDEVSAFLDPLPIRLVPGVGPKTERALLAQGVQTIGDLVRVPLSRVRRAAGGFSRELVALAEGHPVESEEFESSGPKSRSTDRTFPADVHDVAELSAAVIELSTALAEALASERLQYQRVSVGLRWADFSRAQRSRSFPVPQTGAGPLAASAQHLLDGAWREETAGRHRGVRTLSVRVERLTPEPGHVRSLESFEEAGGSNRSVK